MIRQVTGKVLDVTTTGVVIEVAGIGFMLHTPSVDSIQLNAVCTFATHLAVKQDGLELYGFKDPGDRDFFERLITVSGIGPKTAISILRKAPRESLENAIAKRDIMYPTRVAGLGKKSAEKLAVELSEKMVAREGASGSEDAEVFDTLVALGYTDREARKALQSIAESVVGKEARLRAALSSGR